jgi:hypothetical protein
MGIKQGSPWNEWRTYLIGSIPANELIARSETRLKESHIMGSRCGDGKGDEG